MLDIGWSEMMVIAAVAIVVIGPKELPGVLRGVGRSLTKLRKMAGEFRSQFDDALREADLQDLKESANTLRDTMGSFKGGMSPLSAIKNEILSVEEAVKKPLSTPAAPSVATPSVANQPAVIAPETTVIPPVPASAPVPLAVIKENRPKRAKKPSSVAAKPATADLPAPVASKSKPAKAAPKAKSAAKPMPVPAKATVPPAKKPLGETSGKSTARAKAGANA
jgi:sec-independent protein translocase protein TatB